MDLPFFFTVTKLSVIWVKGKHVQPNRMPFVIVHQITFQVKRVRKAKVDGTDSVASSDDSQNGESLSGGHSVLEISGPTIPSPGPSGSCVYFHYTSMNTGKSTKVLNLTQLRGKCCVFFLVLCRSLEGLHKPWLAGA